MYALLVETQIFSLLFFWQNQLLVKGLLLLAEKVKLCEGKYREAVLEKCCGLPECRVSPWVPAVGLLKIQCLTIIHMAE